MPREGARHVRLWTIWPHLRRCMAIVAEAGRDNVLTALDLSHCAGNLCAGLGSGSEKKSRGCGTSNNGERQAIGAHKPSGLSLEPPSVSTVFQFPPARPQAAAHYGHRRG